MDLQQYKKDYQEFSGLVSDNVRTLAFAGIAIAWVFRVSAADGTRVPEGLLPPLLFFALSLGFHFLQYLYGALAWYFVFKVREKHYLTLKIADREEAERYASDLTHSEWLPRPIHWLFLLKVCWVVAGYYFLVTFLVHKWLA